MHILKHIREIHLIEMPNHKALAALSDAAEHFANAEGDLLLAPSLAFSPQTEIAAFNAGGGFVWGYSFDYPCSVEVTVKGWCAYPTRGVGYALRRDVAETVCMASMLAAQKNK